jgi:hypothetical protein
MENGKPSPSLEEQIRAMSDKDIDDLFDEVEAERQDQNGSININKQDSELYMKVMLWMAEWINKRRENIEKFVEELEADLGWKAFEFVPLLLPGLKLYPNLDQEIIDYLNYSLTLKEFKTAIEVFEATLYYEHEKSSLDELFSRSKNYATSAGFFDAINFVSKFRQYSLFNNMLVYAQNPFVTYYATEKHWKEAFNRTIKPEARGMVILAPMTPVLIVYDIDETEGPPLPSKLEGFTAVQGKFSEPILQKTLDNCTRNGIQVEKKTLSRLYAGFATRRSVRPGYKMRVAVHDKLAPKEMYGVLTHELAHIYLGHLGCDNDKWWPSRLGLDKATKEIEAEAVSFLLNARLGLEGSSASYLSTYVKDEGALNKVSLDLIVRVAARIEGFGKRLSEDKMKHVNTNTGHENVKQPSLF